MFKDNLKAHFDQIAERINPKRKLKIGDMVIVCSNRTLPGGTYNNNGGNKTELTKPDNSYHYVIREQNSDGSYNIIGQMCWEDGYKQFSSIDGLSRSELRLRTPAKKQS